MEPWIGKSGLWILVQMRLQQGLVVCPKLPKTLGLSFFICRMGAHYLHLGEAVG